MRQLDGETPLCQACALQWEQSMHTLLQMLRWKSLRLLTMLFPGEKPLLTSDLQQHPLNEGRKLSGKPAVWGTQAQRGLYSEESYSGCRQHLEGLACTHVEGNKLFNSQNSCCLLPKAPQSYHVEEQVPVCKPSHGVPLQTLCFCVRVLICKFMEAVDRANRASLSRCQKVAHAVGLPRVGMRKITGEESYAPGWQGR